MAHYLPLPFVHVCGPPNLGASSLPHVASSMHYSYSKPLPLVHMCHSLMLGASSSLDTCCWLGVCWIGGGPTLPSVPLHHTHASTLVYFAWKRNATCPRRLVSLLCYKYPSFFRVLGWILVEETLGAL